MRSKNQYVVACGSYVPLDEKALNNLSTSAKEDKKLGYYTLREKVQPQLLTFADIPEFFRKKKAVDDVSDSEVLQREEKKSYVDKGGKYSELLKLKMSDIVNDAGSNKRTGHPLHESTTDANFSLSKDGNLCHCWRHMVSLNPVQYLCVQAGYSNCLDAGTPHNSKNEGFEGRKYSKLKGDKKALEVAYSEAVKMELVSGEKTNQSEEELKEKLLQEYKQKIINNEDVKKILKDPNFLEIIDREFDKKIVQEHDARKTIFLVSNMRNVENLGKATDNLMLNAVSGVGKDHVSEAVFEIIPVEEKEELIRTTPKVLAYTRNKVIDEKATWKKVTLRMEDVGNDVLNDDCFKVMSSANPNKINYAKIVNKGKIIDVETEGKPPIIITIASANPKEELLRRYPICSLDEGIDQTKEILKRQAEFAQNGKSVDYDDLITNALRCLERIKVKVPFANTLTKIFCPENVIVRTHFPRFLDYIKSSCSLHQYQRIKDEEGYFIAEKRDYDIARMMLIKTTSNILMIPLTQLQQKIMKVFEEDDLQKKSVDDLQEFTGIKKLDIDVEWLRRKLNWLVSKGFLIRESEKRFKEDGKPISKPVYIFSYNKMQKLEIPEWEKISSFTLNSRNTQNSSFSSDTQQEDVSNRSNRTIRSKKEHNALLIKPKKQENPHEY